MVKTRGGDVENPSVPNAPDDVYEEVRRHFSEGETVKLSLAIVTINGWNRLCVGARAIHPVDQAEAA